jgi:hypothetical protein
LKDTAKGKTGGIRGHGAIFWGILFLSGDSWIRPVGIFESGRVVDIREAL